MSLQPFHDPALLSQIQSSTRTERSRQSHRSTEREMYAERVARFIRCRHPIKTAEHVAAETGISYHTVDNFFRRSSAPSIVVLDRLAKAYGIEFLCHVFEWDFLDKPQVMNTPD